MKKEDLHILMLEDNELDAELNQEQLKFLDEYNCIVKVIQDKEEYISEITSTSPPDLILCDYTLPMFNGMEALKELNSRKLLIPFIFVTGTMQEEVAADAIKTGAWDYVVKDRLFRLPLAVKSVLKLKKEKDTANEADKRTQRIVRGIDETSMLVIVIDKDYNIDYVNQNFTKITGFQGSDVFGKSVFSVFSHASRELLDNIRAILQKKEAFTDDFKIFNEDGTFFWERLSITPIFSENNLNSYSIIADDISKQKKLENDLKKSIKELELAKNKAEESDKLKSAFLANLSHEIRTPMNGILGFADLIKTENFSPDAISQYISIIEQSSEQMLNIINDLVDISKIEANIIAIEHHETNLNKLIDELYYFFKPQVYRKGLSFIYEKALDDSESVVMADKVKLEQVLTNLLNNALKFTTEGAIHLKYKIKDKHLIFSVKDTGIGIPAESQSVIFKRFRQVENTYMNQMDGLGLGLSISKSFIEKMGGKIWVKSEYGKGSEFFVELPFKPVKIIPDKKQNQKQPVFNNEAAILIAEDDEICYLYIKHILDNNHLKSYHAENGKKAIQLFNEHPDIKIILMDLKMPIMNGIDAISEIRKKDSKTPIIVQTAYAFDKDKQMALNAGCNDFITKPVKKDLLLEKIALALENI